MNDFKFWDEIKHTHLQPLTVPAPTCSSTRGRTLESYLFFYSHNIFHVQKDELVHSHLIPLHPIYLFLSTPYIPDTHTQRLISTSWAALTVGCITYCWWGIHDVLWTCGRKPAFLNFTSHPPPQPPSLPRSPDSHRRAEAGASNTVW